MDFEAWWKATGCTKSNGEYAFAKKVWEAAVSEEREACAKVCEEDICSCCWPEASQEAAMHLAFMIRERSKVGEQHAQNAGKE